MAVKLNQIIAIEKGVKSKAHATISELHKINQKPDLFSGFAKQYEPVNEDGMKLPEENKRVQFTATEQIRALERTMGELIEVTARKDITNMAARADVVLDGKPILTGVPVSHLLFLEKTLTDVHTFISKLPLLDESEKWTLDNNDGLYKTSGIKTQRTSKEQEALVLYPATDKHPAQTQLITKDVLVGYWNTVKHSGGMPKTERAAMLARVEKLIRAVKEAREEANMTEEVNGQDVANILFSIINPQ